MDWALYFLNVYSFARSGHQFTIHIMWIRSAFCVQVRLSSYRQDAFMSLRSKITVYIKRLVEITMDKRDMTSIYACTWHYRKMHVYNYICHKFERADSPWVAQNVQAKNIIYYLTKKLIAQSSNSWGGGTKFYKKKFHNARGWVGARRIIQFLSN